MKIWKDPVWSKVIATAIVGIFVYIDYQKGFSALFWFLGWLSITRVIFIFFAISFFYLLFYFLRDKINKIFRQDTSFIKYKSDVFFNVYWSWDYRLNNSSYDIKDLSAFCLNCNCRLALQNDHSRLGFYLVSEVLVCEYCNIIVHKLENGERLCHLENRVIRFIEKKIRAQEQVGNNS